MSEGVRFNEGKPRLSLVPSALKRACARALMFGLEKYGLHNWRKGGKNWSYHYIMDSFNRHAEDLLDGKDFDDESGLHHLDHMAANLAFLCELVETGQIVDDRYKQSSTVKLEITEDTIFGEKKTVMGLCAPSVYPSPPGTSDAKSPLMKKEFDGKTAGCYNKISDKAEESKDG